MSDFRLTANVLDSETAEDVSLPSEMPWAILQYTKSQVDAAGAVLVDPDADDDDLDDALTVINNWRSSHSFPLNTLQMSLRRLAKQVDAESLIAQRIKRLRSIGLKLVRFKTMKLSQMQDIGGCRAVVRSVSRVDKLVRLYKESDIKHKLDHVDDYIRQPQRSGYRGVHLIYRYFSDRNQTYNGLKIEMQLRSPLQHAWATAVETVGTFVRQALKSSQGEAEWLRFFALMGTAIAKREGTPPVQNTPTNKRELVRELRQHLKALDVAARLQTYGAALQTLEGPVSKNAHYYLLALDPLANQVTVTGFQAKELGRATDEYLATEKAISSRPGAEAVLVSVESIDSLRRAYPNYFLDTQAFLESVKQAIGGK